MISFLIPAFPLLGFVILVFFGKRLGDPKAGWLGFAAVAMSFIFALITYLDLLLYSEHFRRRTHELFKWIAVGGLEVNASLLIDPLSLTMVLFVTGISALIHLYSVKYMQGDSRYHQFFVYMNLFVFSMIILVLADNFLLMFLGWEGVGACSYFLVGFWFERSAAATAAKKAFVVNRIGDVGLLLGMFLIFTAFGTLTFFDNGFGVLDSTRPIEQITVTAIALLLFIGAIGKSAQLPLHVWLPDAMEGPTPVSALIHAATMVTAGVYLMCRIAPILDLTSVGAETVAIVGAASALVAATIACAQNDIKRVLAYSTMSQLGYMFLAIGSGVYAAGVFHMVTHAFFKALLFLGAGAVIHALHHEQDLKKMGNLRKYMPWTFGTFLVGWLAISGVPPFAGFWSKDEVLLAAWEANKILWLVGAVTVFLTAYYMSRLFFLAFYGTNRWSEGSRTTVPAAKTSKRTKTLKEAKHDNPREVPRTMLIPIAILAFLAAVGGLLNVDFPPSKLALEHFLEPVLGDFGSHLEVPANTVLWLDGISVALALLGIAVSLFIARASHTWPAALEPRILSRAWLIDPLYSLLIEKPGLLVARFSNSFDSRVVDGLVSGAARVVGATGAGLRRAQTGYVRNYALSIAAGTALVLVWALVRSSG